MSEIIYNNFCYAREMRSRQIASDIEKYKGKHHVKGNKLKLRVAPKPGDPIFLNNPDKFENIWFGVVQKVMGSTALVKFRNGKTQEVPISLLRIFEIPTLSDSKEDE